MDRTSFGVFKDIQQGKRGNGHLPILDSNEPIPGDVNGLDAKRIPETISRSATICQISRHGGALNDCLLSKVSVWGPNRTSLQMQLQTASDELGSWPIHIHRDVETFERRQSVCRLLHRA